MIGSFVLIISFLAFLRYQWGIAGSSGSLENRRGLHGCDIARRILDAHGYGRYAVDVSGSRRKTLRSLRQLYLERPVYEGTSLFSIARASRETALLMAARESLMSVFVKINLWRLLGAASFAGWGLLFLSFIHAQLTVLGTLAFGLFFAVFGCALAALPKEYEACEKAFNCLKECREFEVDELVRLKGILESLRFSGLAHIFKVPFETLKQMTRRKEKVNSTHGV